VSSAETMLGVLRALDWRFLACEEPCRQLFNPAPVFADLPAHLCQSGRDDVGRQPGKTVDGI
jgi:hypothetical protein